jgi:hypothetical protein
VFLLNGTPLPLDTPFEANSTLYPANWLRLSSPADREAIGITEVPDPPVYDQRFYWGYTTSGTLIPKDHEGLVVTWVDQTRQTANTLLAPTDWYVVREFDNGTIIPSGVKSWRQDIRYACEGKVSTIEATDSTESLAVYITGPEYPVWPSQTNPETPSGEPLPDNVSTGETITDFSTFSDSGTDTVVF